MRRALALLAFVMLVAGCGSAAPAAAPQPTPAPTSVPAADAGWQGRLYSPTQLTKLGDLYFLVDAWHNRVLYSPTIERDVSAWRLLDDDLAGPHSIDSDGTFYVVEDTGRHRLKVYVRAGEGFQQVQTIEEVGLRPHRVRYDAATQAFYVLASVSQQMAKLVRDGETLRLVYLKDLPFLEGAYTRSMSIIDGEMYFVAGPGRVIAARYADDSYAVTGSYRVPEALGSMNDLFKSERYYYLTATPNAIIRAESLAALDQGTYEDVYEPLGLRGTPYYLSQIDGRYYLPQVAVDDVNEYSGLVVFDERDGAITGAEPLFDFGAPTREDDAEKARLPK